MFLHVGWKDSIDLHPGNRPNDFIVDLPKTLHLEGEWQIALADIKVKTAKKSSFYLLADFCEESLLKGSLYPVLRRVDQKETHYPFPYFLQVTKAEVQSLKLTIVDQNLKPYEVNEFDCTLCLRKL